MKKPKIGIAGSLLILENGAMAGAYRAYVNQNYVQALTKAGAVPVMLPVLPDGADFTEDLRAQLAGLDGLLLPGGYDIDPAFYGEEPKPTLGFTFAGVDAHTLGLIREADRLGLPMFGICKGIQSINVAFGGTLYQGQEEEIPHCLRHQQQAPRQQPAHEIRLAEGSFLRAVLGKTARVNSFHHESVKRVADGFWVTATAADGVIEGIERIDDKKTFACGVQFHPEMMAEFGDAAMQLLFQKFVERCVCRKQGC